jgi:hypothetical protein
MMKETFIDPLLHPFAVNPLAAEGIATGRQSSTFPSPLALSEQHLFVHPHLRPQRRLSAATRLLKSQRQMSIQTQMQIMTNPEPMRGNYWERERRRALH